MATRVFEITCIAVTILFFIFFAMTAWEWFTETRQLYRSTSRTRYRSRSIRHDAWRAEQASARVFDAGHRRMMDAAFRYTWSKWNGGGW